MRRGAMTAAAVERRVGAQSRLVIVPIPEGVADADVVGAMRLFLAGRTNVPSCAALVTWEEGGGLFAREVVADNAASSVVGSGAMRSAFGALLAEVFGTAVRASWSEDGGVGTATTYADELSVSFLREVHDFVTPGTDFVAMLTEQVDPGALVRELRHIHGLRVIYGGVPSHWAADSGTITPGG